MKLDETALLRLEGGLRPIANLQLSQNVRHVILYCALSEKESSGDFSIARTMPNKLQYLEFAFGKLLCN